MNHFFILGSSNRTRGRSGGVPLTIVQLHYSYRNHTCICPVVGILVIHLQDSAIRSGFNHRHSVQADRPSSPLNPLSPSTDRLPHPPLIHRARAVRYRADRAPLPPLPAAVAAPWPLTAAAAAAAPPSYRVDNYGARRRTMREENTSVGDANYGPRRRRSFLWASSDRRLFLTFF